MEAVTLDENLMAKIKAEVDDALKTIAAQNGLETIEINKINFNGAVFSIKVTGRVKRILDVAKLVQVGRDDYGIDAGYIENYILIKEKSYRVIGFEPGPYPVIVERIDTGNAYKLTIKQIEGSYIAGRG